MLKAITVEVLHPDRRTIRPKRLGEILSERVSELRQRVTLVPVVKEVASEGVACWLKPLHATLLRVCNGVGEQARFWVLLVEGRSRGTSCWGWCST